MNLKSVEEVMISDSGELSQVIIFANMASATATTASERKIAVMIRIWGGIVSSMLFSFCFILEEDTSGN